MKDNALTNQATASEHTQQTIHMKKGAEAMKPQELKEEFIRLRAEGNSYSTIAQQLHISKSTCVAWERQLADNIDDLKRARLEELYESYGMMKEARIKALGDTLEKINAAIETADFSEVDPSKLLDFKLKYMDAMKNERVTMRETSLKADDVTAQGIMTAAADLLNRVRDGEITSEQAQRESAVLANLLKSYEQLDIKNQLDALGALIGGHI